jgi:hypothetical protein
VIDLEFSLMVLSAALGIQKSLLPASVASTFSPLQGCSSAQISFITFEVYQHVCAVRILRWFLFFSDHGKEGAVSEAVHSLAKDVRITCGST